MGVVGASVLPEKGHLQKRKGLPREEITREVTLEVGEGRTPVMAESRADLWAGPKAEKMAANTHSRTNIQSPLSMTVLLIYLLLLRIPLTEEIAFHSMVGNKKQKQNINPYEQGKSRTLNNSYQEVCRCFPESWFGGMTGEDRDRDS